MSTGIFEMTTMTLYRGGHPPRYRSNLIDWLTAGREATLDYRKRAFSSEGWKGYLLLPFVELYNYWKRYPAARGFTRPEMLGGLMLAAPFLAAMLDTSAGVATPVAVSKPDSVFTETELVPDIVSRPQLGSYADASYSYPHLRIRTGNATPTLATFNAFIGKKVGGGMYSRLLGVEGSIPKRAMVDANAKRERMFDLKEANNPDITPVARKMRKQYAEMYNTQRTYMTLPQFIAGVTQVHAESLESMDWDGLCADSRFRFDSDACSLLRRMSYDITATEQVTYALTELLPKDKKHRGVFNAWVYDQGLQHYGREFWDLVPAGGDPLASGGPWQFTSYAVSAYTDEKGQPQVGFVTIVSRHAGNRVPESFLDFKRTDHERAALYFRIANYAFLIRDAMKNKKAYATLKRVAVGGHERDLLAFVATSHHAQNKVRKDFALPWLKDGAKRPFTTYLRGRFKEYGERTLINFRGLNAYLDDPRLAVKAARGDKS